MNTKTLFVIAGICSGSWIGSLVAQGSGGTGSAGSSAGSAPGSSSNSGTGSGTSVGTSGTTTSGTAGGSNIGAPSTGGVPNMSPTNRSSIDAANAPAAPGTSATDATRLPPGLSVPPAQPGISPISGLPTSQLPSVSAGTAPVDAQGSSSAGAGTSTPNRATGSTDPAQTGLNVNDPAQVAAHPRTNPQIGMGQPTFVPTPPPAAVAETMTPAPSNNPNQVWVAGHYSWTGGQWTWNPGTWQRPPSPSAVWAPGHYDAQTQRWTEGHWEPNGAPTNTERTTMPRR